MENIQEEGRIYDKKLYKENNPAFQMNICFFTNQHVSKLRGGIERATHELANILKQNGHHIFLANKDRNS